MSLGKRTRMINTTNNKSQKPMKDNSKRDDMINLMREGYGLEIDSFKDHILDILLRVDHPGGTIAIGKSCEAIVTIIKWVSRLTSVIRTVSEASGTLDQIKQYKTSDFVEITFKYMESESSGAGFHFMAVAKKTGNSDVDHTIEVVLSMITGNLETIEL